MRPEPRCWPVVCVGMLLLLLPDALSTLLPILFLACDDGAAKKASKMLLDYGRILKCLVLAKKVKKMTHPMKALMFPG